MEKIIPEEHIQKLQQVSYDKVLNMQPAGDQVFGLAVRLYNETITTHEHLTPDEVLELVCTTITETKIPL
jgi:hypothetical protein